RTVEHRAVRRRASAEVVAPHDAGETLSLRDADHVHVVVRLEGVAEDLVPGLQLVSLVQAHFGERAHRGDTGLLEAALCRPVGAPIRRGAQEPDRARLVAAPVGRLLLDHQAGARLNDRHRDDGAVVRKELRHSDFPAQDSVYRHTAYFPNALISTSTP